MTTIQLQLNKKIAALSYELPYETVVVRYLCAMVGIIVLLYLYFVSASVLNVIAQREASQASAQMQSDIGVLEGKYFALSQIVTPAQASKLGLTQVAESSFVYRLDTVGVVPSTKNAI
jgi:hypothetical protein